MRSSRVLAAIGIAAVAGACRSVAPAASASSPPKPAAERLAPNAPVIPSPSFFETADDTVADVPPRISIHDNDRPESYQLMIGERGIGIIAADDAGVFYAQQTLAQLPRPLHVAVINDSPRFAWRGLHLDVARHFFPASDIKRVLALMAEWKLNRFHWHLTDDQGWRLPVAKHPELTSTGPAYTADEIRDVVAFAAERHIIVVPEIDLPGHTRALLAVHPELSCRQAPLPLPKTWGVFEDVLCIGNPATYTLVDDVLEAAVDLFPGPYIHIGGDEVPTTRWHECPRCKNLHQSDFLARVLPTLHHFKKRVIGWDEVLEQDAPTDMIIMVWRDLATAEAAARLGHDVILNPYARTYLNQAQTKAESDAPLTWEAISDFEPPTEHVLGVQAALWTENITTYAQIEHALFPRLLAIADVAWSSPEARKRSPFRDRLPAALAKLQSEGVGFCSQTER